MPASPTLGYLLEVLLDIEQDLAKQRIDELWKENRVSKNSIKTVGPALLKAFALSPFAHPYELGSLHWKLEEDVLTELFLREQSQRYWLLYICGASNFGVPTPFDLDAALTFSEIIKLRESLFGTYSQHHTNLPWFCLTCTNADWLSYCWHLASTFTMSKELKTRLLRKYDIDMEFCRMHSLKCIQLIGLSGLLCKLGAKRFQEFLDFIDQK